jgi:hypothetical protein
VNDRRVAESRRRGSAPSRSLGAVADGAGRIGLSLRLARIRSGATLRAVCEGFATQCPPYTLSPGTLLSYERAPSAEIMRFLSLTAYLGIGIDKRLTQCGGARHDAPGSDLMADAEFRTLCRELAKQDPSARHGVLRALTSFLRSLRQTRAQRRLYEKAPLLELQRRTT